MKLLTLLEIEMKKVLPIMLVILGLMTLASGALFYRMSSGMSREVVDQLVNSSVSEFVSSNGHVTLVGAMGYGFHSVLFGFTAVILVMVSTFYLWYKEWFGQAKRIYMLFSLRGSRFTILVSKLLTVLMVTFIFYGVILLNLFIGGVILRLVMPDGVVGSHLVTGVITQARPMGLGFSFPLSVMQFFYKIFFVTAGFSAISAWVLLDRSKKVWGFILGLGFCIFLGIMYIRTQTMFLFYDERDFVDWGFAVGISAVNLLVSYVLLNKRVSI